MTTVQMKPTGLLKADPKNPRKDADERELDHLGDDMLARGVLVPLLIRPELIIIDGWRRYLAALRKGIKELPCIVTEKPEAEIPGIRLATVFHKVDLTAYEKAMACVELLESRPGSQMKDIAEYLHIDASSVTRWCSVSRVIQAWKDALKEGKVGISDCYAASKLPEKDQAGLLALKLSGASRDAIEQAGRKSRNGKAPAVRVSSIRCPLPSGTTVVVKGNEISIEDAIEALTELVKAMKKASEEGIDGTTFARVCADKAKAR
jgi:ParB family chromosome partitioning protein